MGRPRDWDILPFRHVAHDLHAEPPVPMREWAQAFNERASDGDVLIGYSLGGRLALHALLDDASRTLKYAAAVVVSAGLGIGSEERAARIERDEAWALRFESDDWTTVIRDWNAQPLFGGHEMPRPEPEYDRLSLAAALRVWSPAMHEHLESRLREIAVPVLWIAGERDSRYAAVARLAGTLLPRAEVWIAQGAGHRVPWERTAQFVEKVSSFLGE